MPCRLHILDFTMIGSWPKDCLMMPLGTPLIDQLTSAWVDANHNQLKNWPEVLSCSHPQFRALVGQSLSLALPCLDTSQTYHQLPFVWTSSPPALCWKHLYIPADAPFGDHRVVDGGLNKREADPVIFERKLQRGDGLRKRCHKKRWETFWRRNADRKLPKATQNMYTQVSETHNDRGYNKLPGASSHWVLKLGTQQTKLHDCTHFHVILKFYLSC